MIINKGNIEEYLLLLIDGELSAAEEREVMTFVEGHEEFRLMLDQYLDTKLEPETLVFNGKESLLKEGTQVLPLRKKKQYITWAAALAIIIGTGVIFKLMTDTKPSMPATIAANNTSILKADTSILNADTSMQQSLIVVQVDKAIEKKPDQNTIAKAEKTNTDTAIASNTVLVKSSAAALEPLPVADYRIAKVEDARMPALTVVLSTSTGENAIEPETDNKLFGNSEKLELINALVNQMEAMKDHVQEKTKGFRIAAIAIRFGNKEYTIGKSFN